MEFWLIAGTLALVVSGLPAMALLRSRDDGEPDTNQGMHIYRDQLAEVDRDVARGILTDEEAGRVRIEVSRRLLDADRAARAAKSASPPRFASATLAIGICVLMLGGSVGLYLSVGAPGYPDMPLAERIALAEEIHRSRMSQAEMEAWIDQAWVAPEGVDPTLLGLMDRLRETVAKNPGELEGLRLLAQYEGLLGNHIAAHSAQSGLVALKGEAATADDYATLAHHLVLAANGFVSPEAEAALRMALQLDPGHSQARYYTGLMLAQGGRPDLTFGIWRALLEQVPPDAPWIQPIMDQIRDVAQAAGIRNVPSAIQAPPLPGPTVEDIETASEMDASDRQDMILGMVKGLAERIDSEGSDSPAEWARLIRSLGVVGDMTRASEFWAKAQERFAGDIEALALIRAAAVDSGALK